MSSKRKDRNTADQNNLPDEEPIEVTWKDLLAMVIAVFQVLTPIILVSVLSITLVVLFITFIWLR